MDWYKTIKRYYDMGIYKLDKSHPLYVGQFVELGKLTPEQFKEITTEDYL